jgi:hypothetical protein
MILGMGTSKISCDLCSGEIIEYYDSSYKGMRGKCPHCKIDFPLE